VHCDYLAHCERPALALRFDEHLKTNLQAQAKEIAARADAVARDGCLAPSEMALFNIGALVQFHSGDLTRAEALCESCMGLALRFYEATGDRKWAAQAVQPFINLCRLSSARGRTADSLAGLNCVVRFAEGMPLQHFRPN